MVTDVVFDFFGTLVRYDDAVVRPDDTRAHRYLVERGLALSPEAFRTGMGEVFAAFEAEACRTLREPLLHDIARAFLSRAGLRDAPQPLVEGFVDCYSEEWSAAAMPLPGLDAFLAGLGRRHRLSVLSNTYHPPLVEEILARAGVRHHFVQVVTSAAFGLRKPDPRIFAHALAGLGATAAQAVFVGDNLEADYLGARGAGWTSYLVDSEGRHPTCPAEHRLRHLFDLAAALEEGARGS
jgi:putative hydrolase of the HAD superfamily